MLKMFTQYGGAAQAILGVLGATVPSVGAAVGAGTGGNAFNVLSGAALSYLGFQGTDASRRTGAQAIGAVNILMGVLSAAGIHEVAGIPLNQSTVSMVVNLVIGVWGLYAGFAGKTATAAR